MSTFIVVASFSPDADLPRMNAVVAEEVARVEALRAEGRLRAVHISPARGRVFLEVLADDEGSARAAVQTLPMAAWWETDVFPTVAPPAATA